MPVPKQTDPQYKLRLTQALKDQLDAAVAKSGRSLNAEILYRLNWSFENEEDQQRSRRYVEWLESGGLGDAPETPFALRSLIEVPHPAAQNEHGASSDEGGQTSTRFAAQLEQVNSTLAALLEENKLMREELSALYKQEAERQRYGDGS